MTCEECILIWEQEGLSSSSVHANLMQAHAMTCIHCRRMLTLEQQLRSALHPPHDSAPSAESWRRLQQRLRKDAVEEQTAYTPDTRPPASGDNKTSTHTPQSLRAAQTWAPQPETNGFGVRNVDEPSIPPKAHPVLKRQRTQVTTPSPPRAQLVRALCAALLTLLCLKPSFIQHKGEPLTSALALDFQATVERQSARERPSLQRAVSGLTLHPEEGLIFRFGVSGGEQLILLERAPDHHLKVLYTRQWDTPPHLYQHLEIQNAQGRVLRYLPDGIPGTYTLLAILQRERTPLNPEQLDDFWRVYVTQYMDDTSATSETHDRALKLEFLQFTYMLAPSHASVQSPDTAASSIAQP